MPKMSSERVYRGEHYTFKKGKKLGQGGNGEVYEAKIIAGDSSKKLAVKFFEAKKDINKRYERFKYGVEKIEAIQKNVDGIIEILDKHVPERFEAGKAWYLMPKCEKFQLNHKCDLKTKLSSMKGLAEAINKLHEHGLTHRDIKPDNILILNGKLVLADFGLLWDESDSSNNRLTTMHERIGPYKISPYELQDIDITRDVVFRKSDVYLFAKVLWMYLEEDDFGFGGQYSRKKGEHIYLDRNKYGTLTLEPIHEMMERATYENFEERLTMEECIKLIQDQIDIINGKMDHMILSQYIDKELCREFIKGASSVESKYNCNVQLHELIGRLVPNSDIFIRDKGIKGHESQIATQRYDYDSDYARLYLYANRKVAVELIFIIASGTIINDNIERNERASGQELLILSLGNITLGDDLVDYYNQQLPTALLNGKYAVPSSYEVVFKAK